MTLLILYLCIAIGVSFMCSILEAVLLSLTPSYIEQVAANNSKRGAKLTKVKDRLDESLSSILILNTFAHTMGAAGVGSQALQVFGVEWETLIAVLLTLAILYFSEIIPKTLGATYWKKLAVTCAYIINWLVILTFPLVWISTRLTKLFSDKKQDGITREEIIALASLGHKDGTLFSQENEYLNNLLNLREKRTEEVLTPRSVVHMLDQSLTISEALEIEESRRFTRIPVYSNTIDEVTGCVLRNDLYEAERQGNGNDLLEAVLLPIQRVSEKLPVQKLLDFLIKQQIHLCLVEDEFGQTSGIVTLEDAIETLIGQEIVDESDTVEDMQELAKEKYRQRLREDKKNSDKS